MSGTIKARTGAGSNQPRIASARPDCRACGETRLSDTSEVDEHPVAGLAVPADPLFDYVDLFEHAPVGYLLLDAAGCIEKINRRGAALLGWDETWLLGRPFSRWVVNNDKQLFAAHQRALRDCSHCESQELRIKNRHGRAISLRLESALAICAGGGAPKSRSIMLDVTGDERSARKLRRLQSQLAHVTRLHTAGEMASCLAHELNQPLGIIVLNCDAGMRLLNAGQSSDYEFAQALIQSREAASFASEIVRHLRSFLHSGDELHTVCELDGLIRDVATLIEVVARDHDIRLVLDIESELPPVRVDAVQIKQVLLNLAHNSIDAMAQFTHAADRVVIAAHCQDGGQIRVSVSDNGPGFRPDRLDRPFNPFYTTKVGGLGMGLCISRTIVQAHGGDLWIARDSSDGATLHFTLPAIDDA